AFRQCCRHGDPSGSTHEPFWVPGGGRGDVVSVQILKIQCRASARIDWPPAACTWFDGAAQAAGTRFKDKTTKRQITRRLMSCSSALRPMGLKKGHRLLLRRSLSDEHYDLDYEGCQEVYGQGSRRLHLCCNLSRFCDAAMSKRDCRPSRAVSPQIPGDNSRY